MQDESMISPHRLEQPEADALDQARPTGAEPRTEAATQPEASDGDLADQAREVGPFEDDD